jgi:uncharacterized membrane protein YkoI
MAGEPHDRLEARSGGFFTYKSNIPMKNITTRCLTAGVLAALAAGAAAHGRADESGEKAPVGSIRPAGKIARADLPALAKISFADASKAALAAVSGNIIEADLEVEDDNLQYSFDIVAADKSIAEVEIDAGNGKVLDIDKDGGNSDDDDDKGAGPKSGDKEDKD